MIRSGRKNQDDLLQAGSARVRRNGRAVKTALIVSLVALGVLAIFTPSLVMSQVGTKAPPPAPPAKKNSARKVTRKYVKAPPTAQPQAPTGERNPRPSTETPEQETHADRQMPALAELQNSFVRIPAGEFMMGSENGYTDEKPVHPVRISRSFEMGKYEVTQSQWEALMGTNRSSFKGASLPVEQVSWDEAQEFIQKLNARGDGYLYRLPTEAEWEYACRAGSTGDYSGNLDDLAWYKDNSEDKTHPVGQKRPNDWGLYDMHGNVWEWCQDWYDAGYYLRSPEVDPEGPSSGLARVFRGGGWFYQSSLLRSAIRNGAAPYSFFNALGFRLVRTRR